MSGHGAQLALITFTRKATARHKRVATAEHQDLGCFSSDFFLDVDDKRASRPSGGQRALQDPSKVRPRQ
ncbi:hypothetical protein PISMIDRAFT_676444 [Pisolithus microcarpus 441]|uniref:Uncharacterized protein n=1 Tax=Pisolithus microcarpus 441 TaxID=765257 RepID=A0A0C9ZJ07_9AGAM|nr:hypothetical protein PISMIDRAFT_676444 [Pisolithus microcarpus 441]